MRAYESRFRPWLDDPGPWQPWADEDDDVKTIAAMRESYGETAIESLREGFGANAMLFGGIEFVDRLARLPVQAEALFRTAIAVAAFDYYLARATFPRAEPGGETNPSNKKRWNELGPYLRERVREVLSEHFSGSLLSRAVLVTTPDNPCSAREVERRVRKQFDDSGMFTSVDVDVDMPAPVVGGAAWIRSETLSALESVRTALAEKRPALVEVIRDPESTPSSAQIVVVFRIEEAESGPKRLYCYEPLEPSTPVALEIWSGPREMRIYDMDPDDELAAPRGIRAIALPKASPPLFGIRRLTRRVLPWRFFWWLKRRWNTFPFRKRERQLAVTKASGMVRETEQPVE